MTRSYASQWMRDAARCQIIAFKAVQGLPLLCGVPRYLVGQALRRLLSWGFEARPLHRFQKRLQLSQTLGEIAGYRHLEKCSGGGSAPGSPARPGPAGAA